MAKAAVAITGLGVVCPLGNDVSSAWQGLLDGRQGVRHITAFDASGFPTRIAAEVQGFDVKGRIPGRYRKHTVPFTEFALAAADEAMINAGIRPGANDAARWGLVVGAGMMTAEYAYWERFRSRFKVTEGVDWRAYAREFQGFYQPHDFGKTVSNAGLALLAQRYQIHGPCLSLHTACASGGQALGMGMQLIRRGQVDRVLVGGFDSMINPVGLSSFCLLGALSTQNDCPSSASRPFDAHRHGFVLGEGAAFLVLERRELAAKRAQPVYALLSGEGNTLSSYRITDSPPSGEGASDAITLALKDAGVDAESVDYVNAHGTSTLMNDLSETNAIKAALGQRSGDIPVSSTKSQTGHLIAAAGALEGVFTALSIHHQTVPMTMNRTTPDPQCDLDYVTDGVRAASIAVALSNSFGFGGSNSCLVFKESGATF